MEKKILFLIFVIVLLLYYPVLGTYFTGDDFFHFKVSIFHEGKIFFFRPIFREFLYYTFYNLFGLNQLPFRILQISLHLANIYLVYKIISRIFLNKVAGLFAAFFFGVTAANVGALYYLAGGIQTQGAAFFIFLTVLLFWEEKTLLSLFTFVLALMSHELAIGTPLILVGISLLEKKKLLKTLPYFIASSGLIYINLYGIGLPKGESAYDLSFNLKTTLNTLMWYFGWSLGVPEMLVDFVQPGFTLNPNLTQFWGGYFQIIFPALFVLLFTLSLSIIKSRKFTNKLLFLGGWFLVMLLPVLFLPVHKKTLYLQPGLLGISGIIGYLVFGLYRRYKALSFLFIISLIVLSITSIKLGEKTYWAIQRGKISRTLISEILQKQPYLPLGSTIYIKNDSGYPFISKEWGNTSTQAFLALSGSDALQLVYKDPLLKVYYQDREKHPDYASFEFVATIPRE